MATQATEKGARQDQSAQIEKAEKNPQQGDLTGARGWYPFGFGVSPGGLFPDVALCPDEKND